MARAIRQPQFVSALQAMLPDADITLIRERPWFSATMAGQQLKLRLHLYGEDADRRVQELCVELPKADFALPHDFVDSIAIDSLTSDESGATLELEALVVEG